MQPEEGKPRKGSPHGAGPRASSSDPLPPIVSAALEEHSESLLARLNRIEKHSPSSERYTIIGEIGRGGMGRVLRVWDNDLGRELAMKVIPITPEGELTEEDRSDHERRIGRFINEARVTGQLDHPGIPPVHEIGVNDEGLLYFTMPYVRGMDLEKVFECVRTGAEGWNRTRALNALLNVCMTVAFAHSEDKGIVHRDLKPSNIMVGEFNEAYVMDWGLALVLGMQEQSRVVGTPAYMPPEQAMARAEDIGPRSDVYALGAILYELLVGRMPHQLSLEEGKADLDTVVGVPPRRISKAAPDTPGELAAICEKAMARDPEDRYEDAGAMAKELRAFLENRVVASYESGTLPRLRKWRQRNLNLALALEALVLLVAISFTALYLLNRDRLSKVEAAKKHAEDESAIAIAYAYANDIRMAEMYLERGETGEAKTVFAREDQYDPEQLGWEWEYLRSKVDSSLRTLELEKDRPIAHGPLSDLVLTVSDDRTLRLLDTTSEAVLGTLEGHEHTISVAAFGPRDQYLASGDEENHVILWDVEDGEAIRMFRGDEEYGVTSICFSPSGEHLAWSEGPRIHVREVMGGGVVADIFDPSESDDLDPGSANFTQIVYGDAEDRIITVNKYNHVEIWSIPAGERIATRSREGDFQPAPPIAVHRGAAVLAVGSKKPSVHILNASTLESVTDLPLSSCLAGGLAFDGDRLIVGTNRNTLEIWDVRARKCISRQYGHNRNVIGVHVRRDDGLITSYSIDETVRTWKPQGGAELLAPSGEDRIRCLAFSPDGRTILAGSADAELGDPRLSFWDSRTGELRESIETPGVVDCISFHPTNGSYAYACNEGWISERPTPIYIRRPGREPELELHGHEYFIDTIAFSPDGRHLISRDTGGVIRLWDVRDGREVYRDEGLDENNASVAFNPTGDLFATGSEEGVVEIRRADDGSLVRTESWEEGIWALTFSADRNWLAAGTHKGTIVIWQTTGGESAKVLEDPESIITSFAFHPDGSRIVAGSATGTVRLWDTEREELLLTLREGLQNVTTVAFSPKGDRIAAACFEGIWIWNVPAPTDAIPRHGPR